MRRGKAIALVNTLLIVITLIIMSTSLWIVWISSTLETELGIIESDISLRKYKFHTVSGGRLIKKSVMLYDACELSTDPLAVAAASDNVTAKGTANNPISETKLCKLYKDSIVLQCLTVTGIVFIVINTVVVITFLLFVKKGTICFKICTVVFSVLSFILFFWAFVEYSVRASKMDDVKYKAGWIMYLIGTIFSVASIVLSAFSSNNTSYIFLSGDFQIN